MTSSEQQKIIGGIALLVGIIIAIATHTTAGALIAVFLILVVLLSQSPPQRDVNLFVAMALLACGIIVFVNADAVWEYIVGGLLGLMGLGGLTQ